MTRPWIVTAPPGYKGNLSDIGRALLAVLPGPNGVLVNPDLGDGEPAYAQRPAPEPPPVEPCPEGFHWIGQRWSSCDRCGHPAWEHNGMATNPVGDSLAAIWEGDTKMVLRPWSEAEKGALERWRAEWERQPKRASHW